MGGWFVSYNLLLNQNFFVVLFSKLAFENSIPFKRYLKLSKGLNTATVVAL